MLSFVHDFLFSFMMTTVLSSVFFYQAARFFSDLHMYSITTNRWSQISTCASLNSVTPPAIAFHSASILGDKMVVFGGTELYDTRYVI